MRNVIKITTIALALTFLSAMVLSAQEHNHMHKSDKTQQMKDTQKTDKNGDGVIYQCPMKCEDATDKPGECSKCGMKLSKISINDTNKTMKCDDKEKKCCGDKEAKSNKSQMMKKHGEKMDHSKMMGDHSKMEKSIVHEGIIDLKKIDKNNDGKVFQDMMDWHVISDKAGDCPVCGMTLKEVSIEDAVKNLNKHGFKTK